MWDLKVCRACLATDIKLFHIQRHNLQTSYESLSGLKLSSIDGMPPNVCVECAALLKKYTIFRKKCRRAHFALKQILDANIDLTEEYIKEFDRSKVNLTSLIAPCTLPQIVFMMGENKRKTPVDSPIPTMKIYNVTSVDIPPQTMGLQIQGARLNQVKKRRVDVNKATNEESTKAIARPYKLNIKIENGEIIMEPSEVDKPLNVEEANSDIQRNDNIFNNDNREFQMLEVYNNYGVLMNNSPVRTEASATIGEENVGIPNAIHDSVVDYHNTAAPAKEGLNDDMVDRILEENLNTVIDNVTQEELNFDVTPFLNPAEQRVEVEKKKTSSNYIHAAYKCELCFVGFLEEREFLDHQQKHSEVVCGRFECNACYVRFMTRQRMREHVDNHHARKFACKLCSFYCFNWNQAVVHNNLHKGSYTCELCGEIFAELSLRSIHLRIMHPKKNKCAFCPSRFVSEADVIDHQRDMHMDKVQRLIESYNIDENDTEFTMEFEEESLDELRIEQETKEETVEPEVVKSKNKSKTPKVRRLNYDKYDFSVVTLEPEEQRAQMEKRKTLSTYIYAAFKCELCFRGFLEEKTLLTHQLKHDEAVSGQFECEICHGRYISEKRLQMHHFNFHLRIFSCNLCPYTCVNTTALLSHHGWHKGVTFVCEQCGKSFRKRSSYLSHLRAERPAQFRCELCSNTFVSEVGVELHKRLVHKGSDLMSDPQEVVDIDSYCTMCGVQFESVPAYTKHVLNAPGHPSRTIMNGCKTCGETFASKSELREHSMIHRQPMKCLRCNLLLNDGSKYLVHRHCPRPTTDKFYCEWCGKDFVRQPNLHKHIQAHMNLREFKCDQCPKVYNVKSCLDIHLRSHSDERPHVCPICDKAFKIKSSLTCHVKIHSGLKPYECTICGNAFKQRSALRLHIRTVHHKLPGPVRKNRRGQRAQFGYKRPPS